MPKHSRYIKYLIEKSLVMPFIHRGKTPWNSRLWEGQDWADTLTCWGCFYYKTEPNFIHFQANGFTGETLKILLYFLWNTGNFNHIWLIRSCMVKLLQPCVSTYTFIKLNQYTIAESLWKKLFSACHQRADTMSVRHAKPFMWIGLQDPVIANSLPIFLRQDCCWRQLCSRIIN